METKIERGSGNVFADLGCPEPEISRLLRGDFHDYSVKHLLRLLTFLGMDVEIVIKESRLGRQGRLGVAAP